MNVGLALALGLALGCVGVWGVGEGWRQAQAPDRYARVPAKREPQRER